MKTTNPLHIVTVDDDARFQHTFNEKLHKLLSGMGLEFSLHSFGSYGDALQYSGELHLAFIDIEIRDDNGIRLAQQMAEKHEASFLVVFVTNHDSYAKQSFGAHPYDYINKAEVDKELHRVLFDAIHAITEKDRIFVDGEARFVNKSDIMYISSEKNMTIVHYKTGKTESFRLPLRWWKDRVGVCFVQCHNRHIVNLDYVSSFPNYNTKILTLTNNEILPVSERRKKATIDAVHSYVRLFGNLE